MPHLVRWQNELADFGLIIVGAHRQSATPDDIKKIARATGINYSITNGSVSGGKSAGIPHAFIFDSEGKCVFDGHPAEAEKKLRSALGTAIVAKTGRSEFSKSISSQVEALKAGKSPAGVLAKLLPLVRASDSETAAQAQALTDALMAPAKAAIETARSQKTEDPLAAHDRALRMSMAFKNTPVGVEASKLLSELKSDKTVVAELRARPLMEKLRALDQLLVKAMGDKEANDPAFQKAAAAQLRQLQNSAGQIKRNYPETHAAKDAIAIAEKYGLTVK